MGLFKRWFNKNKNIEFTPIKEDITLGTVKNFDDVQIKIGDCIYDGWVYGKTTTKVYIVYTNANNKLDYVEFTIERPLNRKEITENNITLIL
jgi:hypothetical protein